MTIRSELITGLVREIHAEPFQPRRKHLPVGPSVTGWPARLGTYFWPKPEVSYAVTSEMLGPWFEAAGQLSHRLATHGAWNSEERARASDLAMKMLVWGGVPRQKEFSPDTVERVFRLDRVMAGLTGAEPKVIFPKVGVVAGRGGSRAVKRTTALRWSHAYGSWSAQVAGSRLVLEIRDAINAGDYPAMPLPDGRRGPWTIRGVESVLFMDGY